MSTYLTELIAAHGLSAVTDLILAKAKPALYLTLGATGEGEQGCTRIGGAPDLPPSFAWPTDEDGDPCTFALQINLADVPAFAGNPFPPAGLLSVFIGIDEPATDVTHQFYLFADSSICQRRAVPKEFEAEKFNETFAEIEPHGLKVVLGQSLPLWATNEQAALIEELLEATPDADEDKLSDAYEDLTNELAPTNTVARLLGYAAGIGSDPREDAYVVRDVNPDWLYNYTERDKLDMTQANHWQHLLTINSVQRLDLWIWDAGYLQFLIKDSDLAALNFKQMYAAVESS